MKRTPFPRTYIDFEWEIKERKENHETKKKKKKKNYPSALSP